MLLLLIISSTCATDGRNPICEWCDGVAGGMYLWRTMTSGGEWVRSPNLLQFKYKIWRYYFPNNQSARGTQKSAEWQAGWVMEGNITPRRGSRCHQPPPTGHIDDDRLLLWEVPDWMTVIPRMGKYCKAYVLCTRKTDRQWRWIEMLSYDTRCCQMADKTEWNINSRSEHETFNLPLCILYTYSRRYI